MISIFYIFENLIGDLRKLDRSTYLYLYMLETLSREKLIKEP